MLDPGLGYQRHKTRTKTETEQARRPGHLKAVPELHPILSQTDPNVTRRIFPWVSWIVDHYFRSEVEGAENLTVSKALLVSTHNGGIFTPDAYCLAVAFWRRFGLEARAYGLMHKQGFKVPILRSLLPKLGAIPASRENAGIVLEAGFPAFVCPGGDIDVLKPFWQRHRIVFGNRTGFITAAIRHEAPIIPAVSVGAHETLLVLNDGRWLARVSGAGRVFRVKTIPLALGFPFGITPAGLLNLPLPSKVVLRILPAIELCEPPEKADDPDTVARCFRHVTQTMQAALTDLASKRKFPVIG
jgi:1-acyl-sn-glycerol-3-phosphate acyltransferase